MSMKDPDPLKRALAELDEGYEPIRELGRGATSIVYLVRDHALGRNVAVKVIRSAFGPDAESVARLEREARLVAQLQHPNIVRLYGTRSLEDGSLVLLMEHVPGRNLKELVRDEGALDVPRALGILRDVASALAYAHRRRIVHRDVKPENIYLDDEVGTARLADFGVAKPWDRDTRLTLPGESLGTPAYMSPEQIDDKSVDGRSDVYSLGLVGYEMLAGRHPWEGENLFSVIFKQKNEELPPLGSVRRDVPEGVVHLLERSLRKEPGDRWASAEDFLQRLKELESGEAEGVHFLDETPPPEPMAPAPAPPPARERTAGPEHASPESAPAPLAPPPAVPAVPPSPEEAAAAAPGEEEEPARAHLAWVDATWQGEGEEEAGEEEEAPARRSAGRAVWAAGAAVLLLAAIGAGWWVWSGRAAEAGPPAAPVASAPGGPTQGGAGTGAPAAGDPAGAPLALAAAGPVVLEGPAGEVIPLEVRVRDDSGQFRSGVVVRFQGLPGEALPEPDSVTSDVTGLARTQVRLPLDPGITDVVAFLQDDPETRVRFELQVTRGLPAALTPLLGGGQEGEPGSVLPQPLGVRVTDARGNPVPDAPVLFQSVAGGGQLLPARARTDSLGRAYARWRLGSGPGDHRVRVLVEGADAVAPALFEATGVAPEAGDPPAAAAAAPATTPPSQPSAGQGAAARPTAAEAPPVRVAPRPYAVGGTHVCRTAGPRVTCRGANDRGQARSGTTPSPLVALAVGVAHTCGLTLEGAAWCWGANESGQLGDGTRTDRGVPTEVEGGVPFQWLAAGLGHTCGLDGRGAAWCWGRNVGGQLGDGTRDDHAGPRPSSGAARFRVLVAGWNHTCGLDPSGNAWCWGLNGEGQIGDGSRLDRLVPTRVAGGTGLQLLAAGNAHTCGVAGGEVRCWGDNRFGQLGTGETGVSGRPVTVQGLPAGATRVVAGAVHTCALLGDGRVFCWGQNLHGQLGDGSTTNRLVPTPVAGDLRFRTLEAGGGMTCGVAEDGQEYCWGLNQAGQLGDGTRTNRSVPTPVGG